MKTRLIAPCLALGSPAAFLVAGIAFACGAPADAALLVGFVGCTLVGWRVINSFDRR